MIALDSTALAWPVGGIERASGNRSWVSFARTRWRDVDAVLLAEREMLEDAAREPDPWGYARDCDDEIYDLCGADLDLGTVAATLALNAARCPSSMSCNGHGRNPAYVQFWTRPPKVPILIGAACAARVGLVNHDGGGVEVYSIELDGLYRFAVELRARSRALRLARPIAAHAVTPGVQSCR